MGSDLVDSVGAGNGLVSAEQDGSQQSQSVDKRQRKLHFKNGTVFCNIKISLHKNNVYSGVRVAAPNLNLNIREKVNSINYSCMGCTPLCKVHTSSAMAT